MAKSNHGYKPIGGIIYLIVVIIWIASAVVIPFLFVVRTIRNFSLVPILVYDLLYRRAKQVNKKTNFVMQLRKLIQPFVNRYFDIEHLTPNILVEKPNWTKPQTVLGGPHSVFAFALMQSVFSTVDPNVIVAGHASVVDTPLAFIVAKVWGCEGLLVLKDHNIKREMSLAKRDILLIPGGFGELNCFTDNATIIDHSKWGYWVLRSVQYGYDISFQWILGGNKTYHSLDFLPCLKEWCAKRNIPCVLPIGKNLSIIPHNDAQMYLISFRKTLPHDPNANKDSVRYLLKELHIEVQQLLKRFSVQVASVEKNISFVTKL